MYITGYRDINDSRYYVFLIVHTFHLEKYFYINFLIDTGAVRTQISWNDADFNGIIIRALPKDNAVFTGIAAGRIQGYNLPLSTLYFYTNFGFQNMPAGNLSVGDFKTLEGIDCPPTRSMLGIDILKRFDILFEENEVFLRNKYF